MDCILDVQSLQYGGPPVSADPSIEVRPPTPGTLPMSSEEVRFLDDYFSIDRQVAVHSRGSPSQTTPLLSTMATGVRTPSPVFLNSPRYAPRSPTVPLPDEEDMSGTWSLGTDPLGELFPPDPRSPVLSISTATRTRRTSPRVHPYNPYLREMRRSSYGERSMEGEGSMDGPGPVPGGSEMRGERGRGFHW
jgi:hypothetical protein